VLTYLLKTCIGKGKPALKASGILRQNKMRLTIKIRLGLCESITLAILLYNQETWSVTALDPLHLFEKSIE